MSDSPYVHRHPYRASKGRWGDSLPKTIPVREAMELDGLGPAYDPDTGKGLSVVRWYTTKELADKGYTEAQIQDAIAASPAGKPASGDLSWEGITRPTPKGTATDPRKNRTPRKGDENLYVHAPASNMEFTAQFGKGALSVLATPTGDLPYDPALLDMAIGMMYSARAERLGKRFPNK